MANKLTLLIILSVCCSVFINSTDNTNPNKSVSPKKQYNVVSADGEIIGCPQKPLNKMPPAVWDSPHKTVYEPNGTDNINSIITTEITWPNERTTYDYQSNGNMRMLVQDPNDPQLIYAVFMSDPVGATGFPDRRTKFYVSTDVGVSWVSYGNLPDLKSGFPSTDVLSDGREIVVNHSTDGGLSSNRTQIYIDVVGGAGSFIRLTPPSVTAGDEPEFPKVIATANVNLTNKFFMIGAGITAGVPYTNIATSLNTGTFSGWVSRPYVGGSEAYALSRGSDGRIGLIYVNNDTYNPGSAGNVYLMQSTDNGNTFSSAIPIWQTILNEDTLGCVRSCDICYKGNTPNVTFAVCKIDRLGSYFPQSLGKIMFWSPVINGGIPVTIDTCTMLRGSNLQSDIYFNDCHPVIGRSSDSATLYIAWCRARADTGQNGNTFFDVYYSYSTNSGLNWGANSKVTNNSGPLRDCRYVSMSQFNSRVSGARCINLTYQMDSIPGSYVNGAQKSFARLMYAQILINDPDKVQNISGEIPAAYSLKQNYPNPFNPATKIEFDLPKNSFVSLKIYDATGRLTDVLINKELSAGIKSINWNASHMPSGVYFCVLQTGNFRDTKKMVLIK